MKVPFIDLKRFEPGFLDRWLNTIEKLTTEANFMGGQQVELFEKSLADLTGIDNVISCANGTDALQLALRSSGVGIGDKVAIPNLTFWATFEAVVNVGAVPITVDVSLGDAAIDYDCLKTAIKIHRLKAVILVHLYGWGSENIESIRQLCINEGVILIEDGAQCYGAEFNGESIYKNAFIATTSFYPAKVLGAAGDGGAVFTNDAKIAKKLRQLSNHGRSSHYGYDLVGWNSRLDSIQAAYLNLVLEVFPQRLISRRQAANYYHNRLESIGVKQLLPPNRFLENGYCNVCLIDDLNIKKNLESSLRDANIGYGNIYPAPMSQQVGARNHLIDHVGGINAEIICESVLNLPLFAYILDEELERVIDIVEHKL